MGIKDNLIAVIISGLSSGDEETRNKTLKMMDDLKEEFEKMSKPIEQQFYEAFDIKGEPPITDSIFLKLEDILFNNVFFDGIHIYNPKCANDYWYYQLSYRKGGYYDRGCGDTRFEALLNQFIVIMQDNYTIEKQEKEVIYNEVRKIMDCTECENETMLKYSDLMIEYDKIKRWNKILNDCLDTKDELCKALREDNENLRYKNKLYLEKIKKLEGK